MLSLITPRTRRSWRDSVKSPWLGEVRRRLRRALRLLARHTLCPLGLHLRREEQRRTRLRVLRVCTCRACGHQRLYSLFGDGWLLLGPLLGSPRGVLRRCDYDTDLARRIEAHHGEN